MVAFQMTLFKRATIYMIKSYGKSITLLLLIFTLGIVLSGAISVRNAIIVSEERLMMQVPSVATLRIS